MICAVDECEARIHSRHGWCKIHYSRWRRTGNPLGRYKITDDDRFWLRVVEGLPPPTKEHLGPCWIWTGAKSSGYGYFGFDGKSGPAHRWAYQNLVSEDIDGLDLDHLCRHPSCVNPWHLEPVTHKVNMQRSVPGNSKKTHCPQNHPYSAENTYHIPGGGRACKTCSNAQSRRWRERHMPSR